MTCRFKHSLCHVGAEECFVYRTDSPGSSFFHWLKSVEDHSPFIPCFSLQYADICPLTDDVHTICNLLKLHTTTGWQQIFHMIQSLDSHNTIDLIKIHVSQRLIRSTFILNTDEPNTRNSFSAVIIAPSDDAASEVIGHISEILRGVGTIRLRFQPKLLQSHLLSVSRMLQKELQQATTTYRCAAERALILSRKKNLNSAEIGTCGNEVLLGPRLRLRVPQEIAVRNISLQIVSNRGISSLIWAKTVEENIV